jgi:DNA-binding SARP family transcriptional activator/Tfp pilus assembly protein PilF
MRVCILGPLRVEVDGGPVRLGPQLQALLAVLVLARGRTVSRARLAELVWGEPLPAAAETTLRSHVAHLRRVIEPGRAHGAPAAVLVSDGAGYALRLTPEQLDAARFTELVERGLGALRAGDPASGVRDLTEALDLWYGPVLGELGGRSFAVAEVARLNGLRESARDARIEAELALGRHEAAVAELTGLVADEPHEQAHRLRLARALYGCGRRQEAAEVCRQGLLLLRGRGIDSTALRKLHEAILRGAVDDRPRGPVPRQLPPDVAEFTGRGPESSAVAGYLVADRSTVAICALSGQPGIGKSALAVHVAHRVAERFADGALYVDLRGAAADRKEPHAVLGGFLRAFGTPAHLVPADLDAAAAAYRTALAGRSVLVVLDNAADAAQVRPLLPAEPRCAALVTSRAQLADLEGAWLLSLGLLPEPDAIALLGRAIGPRVRTEHAAAADVVRLCGRLPLAIRIAGSRLRAQPRWPVAALAGRLADEHRRLGELAVGDQDVRSSFALSYRALPPADARLFRLLGLLDGPDAAADVVAALADRPPVEAGAALERLFDAHLVESPSVGRYRLHDLLTLFARERAVAEESTTDRRAAVLRALLWYATTAERAAVVIRERDTPAEPDERFADRAEAMRWFDTERANLVAAAAGAADRAEAQADAEAEAEADADMAWRLGAATVAYLNMSKHWPEWHTLGHAVLRSARAAGRPDHEARAHYWLGTLLCQQRRLAEAATHLERAVALLQAASEADPEANTADLAASLGDLGVVCAHRGRTDEAIDYLLRGLAAARASATRHVEARILNNLALAHAQRDQYEQAHECVRLAVSISEQIGQQRQTAICTDTMAGLYHAQGRYQRAIECYQASLSTFRRIGDSFGTAMALRGLGTARAALLGEAAGVPCWTEALAIFEELRVPEADDVRALLDRPAN